jgi:stage II sporulation protein D
MRLRLLLIILFLVLIINSVSAAEQGETNLSVKLSLDPPFSLEFSRPVQLFFTKERRLGKNLNSTEWEPVERGVLRAGIKWQIDFVGGKILITSGLGDRISSELPLMLSGDPGDGLKINGREYPGSIQIWPAKNLVVINYLGLEEYVASVLAAEAYAGWPEAALKANAVAIRTYSLYNLNKHQEYDLCDQVHCQIYRGGRASQIFKEAVVACKGEVLTWQGSLINAVYHSSSGGRTQNNEEVWEGTPLPYLRGVKDFDQGSKNYYWPESFFFSLQELATAVDLSAKQGIEIAPLYATNGNRLAFRFSSLDNGEEKVLRNTSLRWLFSFPSCNFQAFKIKEEAIKEGLVETAGLQLGKAELNNNELILDVKIKTKIIGEEITKPIKMRPGENILFIGKGSGHGVGLSQWGAAALAEQDYDYQQILRYYYGDTIQITGFR